MLLSLNLTSYEWILALAKPPTTLNARIGLRLKCPHQDCIRGEFAKAGTLYNHLLSSNCKILNHIYDLAGKAIQNMIV
jgi:hypothetical protein